MNNSPYDRKLSHTELAALMDNARQRALEARGEVIDAFWNAALRHLASAWRALSRAALRPATALRAEEPACRP